MASTLGIVQLLLPSESNASNRLAESLLGRTLGGKSLLNWVVRRVTEAQQLSGVIAVIGHCPAREQLAALVPADVPVYLSDATDPLNALSGALREYPADAAVLIPASSPFVEPVFIDRLVITANNHLACDYITYRRRHGTAAVLSKVGMFAEWFRSSAIHRAHREASLPADRNQPTRYLFSHPELFQMRLLAAPSELDRDDVRLRVTNEEDWDHAMAIYDALGPDDLDWHRIAGLLDQQPALRERMAVLNKTDAED